MNQFTKAHAERATKDYDSRPGINGEVERLRAEIERLTTALNRAHHALLTIELDCGAAWRAYDGTPQGNAFKSTADFARAIRADRSAFEQNGRE